MCKLALICFTVLVIFSWTEEINSYIVGAGLNIRFAQLLPKDPKYMLLREELVKKNTKGLVGHCRGDNTDCKTALARTKFKASKQFYALAKAVVAYVKSESTAIPSGYVGTAMFCHENTCIPDMDQPVVTGGCSELISCGGSKLWGLSPVTSRRSNDI